MREGSQKMPSKLEKAQIGESTKGCIGGNMQVRDIMQGYSASQGMYGCMND